MINYNLKGRDDIEEVTKDCLKRVHIFKCENVEELLSNLLKLKQFCFENNKIQFLIQNIDYSSWSKMSESRSILKW